MVRVRISLGGVRCDKPVSHLFDDLIAVHGDPMV